MNETDNRPVEEQEKNPAAVQEETVVVNETAATCGCNDVCAEEESPALAIAEAADKTTEESTAKTSDETADEDNDEAAQGDIDKKTDLRRYHQMSKEQLMQAMRDIIGHNEMEAHKDVAAIKQAFYVIKEAENKKSFDEFIDAGNAPENFVTEVDVLENELKDLLASFKERRNAYLENQEALRTRNLEAKKAVLATLKSIAEDIDNVNLRFSEFQKGQQEFKNIGEVPPGAENDLWKEYQDITELFYDRLKMNKELRDLDFKRNLETKRRIIEEAKTLVGSEDVIGAFQRLQSMHAEWRETGPVAKEFRESIWEEFKETSSAINRRHQEYFEARKAEEKVNEEKKTALCEEAEAIDLSTITTHKAWDEATTKILDIQARWKEVGFAPRKTNSALLTRFRKCCDEFFDKKHEYFRAQKEVNAERVAKKTALCEKAEALADVKSSSAAVGEARKLKDEWRTVGHTGGKIGDQLWDRFMKALNVVFDRNRAENAERRTEEEANLTKKLALIEAARNISVDQPRGEAVKQVRALQDEWQAVGYVPIKQKEKIYKDFREAIDAVFDAYRGKERNNRMSKFEGHLREIKDDGTKMFRERERLIRAYGQKRTELQTYENNMGFFNIKSAAGSTMLKDLEKKISVIKAEMAEIESQINLLDNENKEGSEETKA